MERLVEHLDGKPNSRDQNIIDDLLYSPIERSQASRHVRSGSFNCELRFRAVDARVAHAAAPAYYEHEAPASESPGRCTRWRFVLACGTRKASENRSHQTVINHDGMVALCCAAYDQANLLGVRLLEADFHEIEKTKYAHPYCQTCHRRHLQDAPAELAPLPE